ncbi:LytR C-terminal domain-containing protein [Streptomyces sp. NPDC127068]|uniref:LytR C-terminal domain-containing protein n=1 Tax=Streptomyces sp. NPDC127068 TaxID=3347127 RepID=UPI0036515D79
MSMLTPPGMGGQYRITGGKYPRMRRGRRRGRVVLACAASLTAVGVIGWGTLQLVDVFTGGGNEAKAAGSGCAPASAKPSPGASAGPVNRAAAGLPKPSTVKVNVLNATPRSGLAKKTADELRKRGFTIGEVGNATKQYDKKVPGAGLVVGAKGAARGALPVLAAHLAGAGQRTDARASADVDLIIGTAFTRLAPQDAATRSLTALANPSPKPDPSAAACRNR